MSRARLLAAAALLPIALAACGTVASAPPAAPPPGGISRTVEQGGKFIAFVGPRRQHAAPFLGVPDTNFYTLRSWLDTRSGAQAHQLYVEDSYFGKERNWNAAQLVGGAKLRFIAISKNEITCSGGCSYAEEFAADLPEALMRSNPQGLAVRFTAQSGADMTIVVPGDLVVKQFAAVDAARAALPVAAAQATPPAAPPPAR